QEGEATGLCSEGCQAIVVTGTFLLAVPQHPLERLSFASFPSQFVVHCSYIQSMPTITFIIGGAQFPLPPSAYVFNVRIHSWLPGHWDSVAQTGVPCPSSHLGTYDVSGAPGIRLRLNRNSGPPTGVM
uniref:Peptidase A1 domain-containing protein n=1 Tax=Theropithecus gelada TaxID=9565 RepID=A0A8D2EBT5_THEGE